MGNHRRQGCHSRRGIRAGTYDFAEIVIRVSNLDVANPFTEASVEGHFAQEGSEPVTVDGFCDSTDGSVFRIRFMPSRPGRHEYSITYRQQRPTEDRRQRMAGRGTKAAGRTQRDPQKRGFVGNEAPTSGATNPTRGAKDTSCRRCKNVG